MPATAIPLPSCFLRLETTPKIIPTIEVKNVTYGTQHEKHSEHIPNTNEAMENPFGFSSRLSKVILYC
jgi:hypothetical protein